jgi:hypothetical protein
MWGIRGSLPMPRWLFPIPCSLFPGVDGDPHLHAARPRRSAAHRDRDARVVHRLLDERHRAARPSRRTRRPQARAPPHPVRHAGGGAHPHAPVQEERDRGGRRAGQVPPARRPVGLRRARAHGAGLLAALPAHRRPGELRLHRRRRGGGVPLHRGAAGRHRHGAAGGHRQGHRRLRPQLRRPTHGAARASRPRPQPAGQRLQRHRGGDEHQRAAAQPGGGGARRHPPAGPPGVHRRGPDGARAGARLSHRRHHRGHAGDPRGVRQGARPRGDAGARLQGVAAQRQGAAGRHRDPVRHQQVAHHRTDRRAHPRRQAERHRRPARRERPRRHSRGHRAQARRGPGQGAHRPVQVDGAADHLRRNRAGAGPRRAARAGAQDHPGALPRAPAAGRRPPQPVGAGKGARRGPRAGGLDRRAAQDRPGDRHHPRLPQPRDGRAQAGKGAQAQRAPVRGDPEHAPLPPDAAGGQGAARPAGGAGGADRRAGGAAGVSGAADRRHPPRTGGAGGEVRRPAANHDLRERKGRPHRRHAGRRGSGRHGDARGLREAGAHARLPADGGARRHADRRGVRGWSPAPRTG